MSDRLLLVDYRDETDSADRDALCAAVTAALERRGVQHAAIDLAVVGDAAMHEYNRRWLGHDYPTDVLSFLLEEGGGIATLGGGGWAIEPLGGQVIVNADYAAREAAAHDWPPHELSAATRELMLYAAHGTLHLCGLDDRTDQQRAGMRRAEAAALAACGVAVPDGHGG